MGTVPSNVIFNKTAKSYRKSFGTANEYGEKKISWNIQVSSFICAFKTDTSNSSDGVTRVIAGQIITSTHILYCPITVNIKADDRVEFNSKLYEVKLVDNAAERDSHLKVYLNRLTVSD